MNTTLDSAVKFCPVRIICCPPYTRQLSMSCLSTIGSSWADLWAVDKIQTWMKSTLFYQHFPNLPRTIHRLILSSLPSTDCQSSFSRVLNLGLRGKNKLTQGILFGNIQELAAAFSCAGLTPCPWKRTAWMNELELAHVCFQINGQIFKCRHTAALEPKNSTCREDSTE